MKSNPNLNRLLNPTFLIPLFLLILNDAFLKWNYPSWFTGKLSDFAGLFAFAYFFLVIFQFKHKKALLCAIGATFIWWKSPLSEPFILIFNTTVFFNIDRVVDYTDLSALIVLYFFNNLNTKTPKVNYSLALKYAVVTISLFSFIATSMSPPSPLPPEGDVAINKTYQVKKSEKEILALLSELDLEYDTILTIKNLAFNKYFFSTKQNDQTGFSQYDSPPYLTQDSFERKKYIEMDTLDSVAIDSLTKKKWYQKTKVLRNVKFEGGPLLKYVLFSLHENAKASGKTYSNIEIHSIVFAEKVYRLDNYKKLKKLRRHYKRLIKKEIIKELR